MSKKTNDQLRAAYVEKLKQWLAATDEDILQVGSNEIAIPVVDSEGEDSYIVFTVKVPTGDRDGTPYDGYAMAEDYARKVAANTEKAEQRAKAKAAKIARDEAARAAKSEAKAKHRASR